MDYINLGGLNQDKEKSKSIQKSMVFHFENQITVEKYSFSFHEFCQTRKTANLNLII